MKNLTTYKIFGNEDIKKVKIDLKNLMTWSCSNNNATLELISTHCIVCSDVKVKCCANIFCLQVPTYHLVLEGFLLLWILWSLAKVITEYDRFWRNRYTQFSGFYEKYFSCMFKAQAKYVPYARHHNPLLIRNRS